MSKLLWTAALLLLSSPFAATADATIQPGSWQTQIMLQMSNMPFAPPPRTITRCMNGTTNDEMVKLIVDETLGQDCTKGQLELDEEAAVYHWDFKCNGRRASEGESWLTVLNAQHYQIKTEMKIYSAGRGTMKIDSESKRLGECK